MGLLPSLPVLLLSGNDKMSSQWPWLSLVILLLRCGCSIPKEIFYLKWLIRVDFKFGTESPYVPIDRHSTDIYPSCDLLIYFLNYMKLRQILNVSFWISNNNNTFYVAVTKFLMPSNNNSFGSPNTLKANYYFCPF